MTREEAIKELKEELKEVITWLAITINKEEMYERKERRKRAIEAALIALEQQPKTGRWIAEINDYGEVMGWHCDKCYEDSGFTTTCKWDFCPSCGTKMIESHESEE